MVQSQFLFLFLLRVCCGGRWTFTAFKFVKEALETLDSINHKRSESQREYKVDRLVCVFLNLEVLTSVSWSVGSLFHCCGAFDAGSPAHAALQPPAWASTRHACWETGSVLLCFSMYHSWTTLLPAFLETSYNCSQLLTFLDALPSL